MPTVKDENGTRLDLSFKPEGERLVAASDWEVGHSYELEFDTREIKVRSVAVRLLHTTVRQNEIVDGNASLLRQDPETGIWSPADYSALTSISSAGESKIYEVQSGWGTFRLRLSFRPGTKDRWFEVTRSTK